MCYIIQMGLTLLGAQPCPSVAVSERSAVAYLRHGPAGLEADCVRQALENLAAPQHASEAPLVVRYLDFRIRIPSPQVVVTRRLPPVRADYPAVNTLLRMGLKAGPAVMDALRRSDSTSIARDNALLVFRLLHRDQAEMAVVKLREASLSEKDPVAAGLLLDGAREAARSCSPADREACYKALE